MAPITKFTQLDTWKQAHELVLMVYTCTKHFPSEERYSLTDQIRRCSVSITSNIAEGFSRKGKLEKIQFYYISKGSVTELQNQLLVARDVGYIPQGEFETMAEKAVRVHKLLHGLIRSAESKK